MTSEAEADDLCSLIGERVAVADDDHPNAAVPSGPIALELGPLADCDHEQLARRDDDEPTLVGGYRRTTNGLGVQPHSTSVLEFHVCFMFGRISYGVGDYLRAKHHH